jgi:hypothetical protein
MDLRRCCAHQQCRWLQRGGPCFCVHGTLHTPPGGSGHRVGGEVRSPKGLAWVPFTQVWRFVLLSVLLWRRSIARAAILEPKSRRIRRLIWQCADASAGRTGPCVEPARDFENAVFASPCSLPQNRFFLPAKHPRFTLSFSMIGSYVVRKSTLFASSQTVMRCGCNFSPCSQGEARRRTIRAD